MGPGGREDISLVMVCVIRRLVMITVPGRTISIFASNETVEHSPASSASERYA